MRARNPNSTVSGCGFCSAMDEHLERSGCTVVIASQLIATVERPLQSSHVGVTGVWFWPIPPNGQPVSKPTQRS